MVRQHPANGEPTTGVTVGQLMERWVAHRRPDWEERSPGQADATLARIRNHITPRLGTMALDRLRPVVSTSSTPAGGPPA